MIHRLFVVNLYFILC